MSDFDTVFNHFKDNTKPMCELMGCPELVEDFIVDVEINRQSFKSFYEAGQKSKVQPDTKWVSVKNQLPPNDPYNREYWVYETLNNKVQHDYWVCPDSDLDQDFEPFFNNWFGSVTHWMPMPKSPKSMDRKEADEEPR